MIIDKTALPNEGYGYWIVGTTSEGDYTLFGPFTDRLGAEACLVTVAKRVNVSTAYVYVGSDPPSSRPATSQPDPSTTSQETTRRAANTSRR